MMKIDVQGKLLTEWPCKSNADLSAKPTHSIHPYELSNSASKQSAA